MRPRKHKDKKKNKPTKFPEKTTTAPDRQFLSRPHPYCSTRRSSSSFRSGGKKLASTEFAASSRICSSENSNRSSTSTYSSSRLLPNIGGSSELIVTISPDSKYIFTGCASNSVQQPARMLLLTFTSRR